MGNIILNGVMIDTDSFGRDAKIVIKGTQFIVNPSRDVRKEAKRCFYCSTLLKSSVVSCCNCGSDKFL